QTATQTTPQSAMPADGFARAVAPLTTTASSIHDLLRDRLTSAIGTVKPTPASLSPSPAGPTTTQSTQPSLAGGSYSATRSAVSNVSRDPFAALSAATAPLVKAITGTVDIFAGLAKVAGSFASAVGELSTSLASTLTPVI